MLDPCSPIANPPPAPRPRGAGAKSLFSDHYLRRRLPEHPEWSEDVAGPFERLRVLYDAKRDILSTLIEAQIEAEFIRPALEILDFAYIPQTPTHRAGRVQRPDYALFADEDAKNEAYSFQDDEPAFYARALAIADAKYWERPLSETRRDDSRDTFRNTNPLFQIVNYLIGTGVDWGILTNGRLWRLHYRQASSTATEFYEVDLVEALESGDLERFKYFWLFFRRDAFIKDAQGNTFLDRVRDGSATYARMVGDRLKDRVFEEVFPVLSSGFVAHRAARGADVTSEEARHAIYEATLSLLYKMLFLLYAEARNLLPIGNPGYRAQSLTRMAGEVATRMGLAEPLGRTSTALYDHLLNLFRLIDQGDSGLGLPRYNGGLFHFNFDDSTDQEKHPANWFLTRHKVSDAFLAQALDLLYRADGEPVDYGYIGVRHLGAIYEGLLEHHLAVDDAASGQVHLETDKGERKATGSYYTPDYVVKYIVHHTVGPILEERTQQFDQLMGEIVPRRQRVTQLEVKIAETPPKGWGVRWRDERRALLQELDPLEQEARETLLDIKVCDPAMGSGHFLVEAVDFLTNGLIKILNEHLDHNPVLSMLEHIRREIIASLERQGIPIDPARLDDTQLLQRVVMKRCIYGVDLNPMAVELAKVSLWLHSFTIGAPLSFLDHHLRCGNSLIGVTTRDVDRALRITKQAQRVSREARLLAEGRGEEALEAVTAYQGELWGGPFAGLLRAAEIMRGISLLSDATFTEVEESERLFRQFDEAAKPYKRLLDIFVSRHFGVKRADEFLRLYGADAIQAGPESVGEPYAEVMRQARELYQEKRFFHWDLEFPEVFIDLERATWKENAGFDVVVGNPPYDVLAEKELGYPVDAEKHFFKSNPIYAPAIGRKMNLYRPFVCTGIDKLKQGGHFSYIVPMPLLGDLQAQPLRRWLLQSFEFDRIEAFPQKDDPYDRVFFAAKLPTCIFTLAKQSAEREAVLRVHSGKHILADSPSYSFFPADILDFDPITACIPLLDQDEWELALRLSRDSSLCRCEKVGSSQQGEVNLTSHRQFLSESPPGKVVLRGAHIGRYEFQERPKQGMPFYLDVDAFLSKAGKDTKRYHYKHVRIGYQRGAALDNWRRIIATIIDPGEFCSDTINYFIEAKYDLYALLALLNATIAEWRFRLTSTTNHVNVYEIDALPMPRFSFTTPREERARLVGEGITEATEFTEHTEGAASVSFSAFSASVFGQWLDERLSPIHTPDPALVRQHNADPLNEGWQLPEEGPVEQTDVVHDLLAYLAEQMIEMNRQKQAEIMGFLSWLEREIGVPIDNLTRRTYLRNYLGDYQKRESHLTLEELLDILRKNRRRLGMNPTARAFQERLGQEYRASLETLLPLKSRLAATDRLIDLIVYRLYGLTEEEVAVVEGAK